jgi:8-oxo-dGTP diphosphatase
MKEEIGIEVKLNEYIGKSVLYYMSPENKTCYNLYGSFYTVDEVNRVVKYEDDHELVWMDLDVAISRLKLTYQVWAIEKIVENRC